MRFANGTTDVTYYYEIGHGGDVLGIYDENGTCVASYEYDAWDNLLSSWENVNYDAVALSPFRYRGYIYDGETGFYYLQSRYYDPQTGRFINADAIDYLGVGDEFLSYNLFAYCGNDPISGYDPTGTWNWGGFLVGFGIVAATVITVATLGIGTVVGAVVAAGVIATGTTMMIAAATDSTMVIDASISAPNGAGVYAKSGASIVVDFSEENGGIYRYSHDGGGMGYSSGLSYSTGFVENFNSPKDYSGHFIDVNAGYFFGIDHGFDPTKPYTSAAKATSLTFGFGSNYGLGYDYYSDPITIWKWSK